MRRNNRKNSIKKERIIMLASSAFVLTALTMTGIYMKNSSVEEKNDGYTLDFTALENSADDKLQEIAKAGEGNSSAGTQKRTGNTTLGKEEIQGQAVEDDLDYMPLEAGSGQVEIPGLTDNSPVENEIADNDLLAENESESDEDEGEQTADAEKMDKTTSSQNIVAEKTVSFSESEGLLLPVEGTVLMSYSMDKSIYFATLDQYKYNPAVIFSAALGAEVTASADGKVISIFENEEIGNAVTVDLGNGYQATYGQLEEVKIKKGAYVKAGEKLGMIAAPTKYYSTEGSNLYFKLEKDGSPVDPEGMFQ